MNFLRGVGQPVCVDVGSDAAARTAHVFIRFQAPDRLPEVLSAVRTLKPDLVQIRVGHRKRLGSESQKRIREQTTIVGSHEEAAPARVSHNEVFCS